MNLKSVAMQAALILAVVAVATRVPQIKSVVFDGM